ncbi:S-layer homology domain-containing protein [Rummeliibacillus sp. NPDC094406]|uniref:S-layer homology domain-containing protein n=1 Tax=Rummeliibacillus sp. NPDC094406 TaxID=3364511 RepID=UPI00382734F7
MGNYGYIKAINNTTVEVTFKEAQVAQDIKASRFAIEGLEVKNAAVKQTDSKVVVLTTSAQEAGKTYTLAVDGVKAKSFTAVSSVVPTAVELSTPSIQGVLGKEVTVTSKVTVPDGQSKAGIAVTFNVAANNTFNKDKVIEAFTDENGVAKISYTQYSKGEDTVYAYPTGAANVKTTVGKVYWGNTERLSVIDVTAGTTLANDSKKVYKVTSEENKNSYINVAFKENVNVTPDKLVRTVKVVDATGDSYPYQVTTGGVQYVQVKLDSKGEATFTLQGSNATVTPIVFADGSDDDYKTATKNNKLEATELQAQASSVKFDKIYSQGLKVEAVGTQNAAYDQSTNKADSESINSGGREYTVTITDKDGKLAPKGTKAYVTFKKGDVSSYNDVRINGQLINSATDEVLITVDKDGKATFKLTGAKDAYAAPTVFIENGTDKTELDDADLSFTADKTFFLAPSVKDATLEASKETTSAANPVTFTYQSVDQNGFPYASDYNNGKGGYTVSFEVSATFADVTVTGNGISTANDNNVVKAGTTNTFKVIANANGEATIDVQPKDGLAANVTVNASASQASLPNKSASVAFTKASVIPDTFTGTVTDIDLTKKTIKLATYDAVSYAKATFKNSNGVAINQAEFEAAISKNSSKVTYKKDGDNVTFEIVAANASEDKALVAVNDATSNADAVKAIEDNKALFADWDKLSATQKSNVAAAILANRGPGYGKFSGVKAAYTTAYNNVVSTALNTAKLAAAAVTPAQLKAVPGIDTTELEKLSTALPVAPADSYQVAATKAIGGTATNFDSVATLQTAIDNAVKAQNDLKANADKTAVATSLTTALDSADGSYTLAGAVKALEDNQKVLGYNLYNFATLNQAQKEAVATQLDGVTVDSTKIAAFNKSIKEAIDFVTDAEKPTITTAKLTNNTTLTLTLSENVTPGVTAAGVVKFLAADGKTLSTADYTAFTAGATANEVVITLSDAAADAFEAGATITEITNLVVKDNSAKTNALDITGLNILVK